ncbi:antibiotic biosynthesis monooxygenase family protein [Paenibacillus sp. GCM10027628]|uniref:antibiotic biosynthesis monooxygenase family protein n=1 Tax=Paenibacillus sp. GCM10027628 TaxID=3273413 RepID=UPI003634C62B
MVVEIIRYNVPAGQEEEFLNAYQEASQYLDRSQHCLSYEVIKGMEEPNRYIVRIEWDSLDGHMKGFRTGSDFQPFFAHVRPFFNAIEEMKHYTVTKINSAGK